MKIKKILMASLLSSTLLLGACENLLNNRSKNRNNDYGSNVEENDYTGKKGASELNEEEWNKAFNLEETVLHRSFKLHCVQNKVNVVDSEIDHGRVMMVASSGDFLETSYMELKPASKGLISGAAYSNYDGEWEARSFKNQPILLCASQFGLLPYEYNDFTYDKDSKSYKADHFDVPLYEDFSLEIYDCVIKVENGLPSTVDFTFSSGDEDRYSYSATYSDYGRVSVTLPGVKGEEDNDLPTPEGEVITASQFIAAYEARKEADFNNVVINILEKSEDLNARHRIECDYLYGMWQSRDPKESFNDSVTSLILVDEHIDSLKEATTDISFYYNANKNEYSFAYSTDLLGSTISTVTTYNEYFYAVKQEFLFGETYESLEVSWSKIDQSSLVMSLAGRSFKGVTISEKDFAYFGQYDEIIKTAQIDFVDGLFKLTMSKHIDEDKVIDYEAEAYGAYSQYGNEVTLYLEYVVTDGEVSKIENPNDNDVVRLVIDKDTFSLESTVSDGTNDVKIHALFKYDQPFEGEIVFPDYEEYDDSNYTFRFVYLDYELKEGGTDEEARDAIDALYENEDLVNSLLFSEIYIDEDNGLFYFYQEDGARVGNYKIGGNTINVTFTSFIDRETGERSEITPQNMVFTYDDDLGYIYLRYQEKETFIINIVYSR